MINEIMINELNHNKCVMLLYLDSSTLRKYSRKAALLELRQYIILICIKMSKIRKMTNLI